MKKYVATDDLHTILEIVKICFVLLWVHSLIGLTPIFLTPFLAPPIIRELFSEKRQTVTSLLLGHIRNVRSLPYISMRPDLYRGLATLEYVLCGYDMARRMRDTSDSIIHTSKAIAITPEVAIAVNATVFNVYVHRCLQGYISLSATTKWSFVAAINGGIIAGQVENAKEALDTVVFYARLSH